MPRVKGGIVTRRRHKKRLDMAKGYVGAKSKLFRTATEAVDRALKYAYRDRRAKKRDFRRLWIARVNAAARENGISYSRLIAALQKANVDLDRKVLAEMAVSDPAGFRQLVESVRPQAA